MVAAFIIIANSNKQPGIYSPSLLKLKAYFVFKSKFLNLDQWG